MAASSGVTHHSAYTLQQLLEALLRLFELAATDGREPVSIYG
jgi:DNA-binding ferritin-like protein (Dps family)